MKKLIFASVLSVLALSCKKKETSKQDPVKTDSAETVQQPVDTLGTKTFCYMKVTGKDTVVASIDDNLGTLIGKLAYKNHEKDSSKGDVTGFRSGDTLKLTYEFASEGTTSKRDIFFLQKDNSLFEGLGDQKDNGGQMVYANEKKISYPEDQKLESVDCEKISKLLK
ncbi:hypothetical protein [Chryseobacterium sp. Leaf394]|uniref:hypothetical protein n=1 Tax=Chryseobacterium sp. Leaf394 TaxID=1736361 RepID=UPI0006FBD3B1|nr:hypothetical protein [Chryseobacterium sp. Leaf394]KQS92475.1 hypothetical protein ASG21_08545 [Chryseobacterium sp. Leaf394]